MIVRMKKLTLLCLRAEVDLTLEALRDLGAVQVVNMKAPAGDELEEEQRLLASAVRADDLLAALEREVGNKAKKGAKTPKSEGTLAGDEIIAQTLEAAAAKKEALDRAGTLRSELKVLEPLGDFDPVAFHRLADAGLTVKVFRAEGALQLPDLGDLTMTRLAQSGVGTYFALAGRGDFGAESLGFGPHVAEIRIPERSPADTRRLVSECEQKASEADGRLRALVNGRGKVRAHKAFVQERVKFFKVREGMEASGAVAYLQGWIPAERSPEIQAAAAQHGWGIVFDDPTPGEPVPTLLHYSRWIRPIMSMFRLLGIYPGYWESDVGWTFLIFFSIFFGMLVGDAVYGTLLLIATIVAGRKLKKTPRYVFGLLYIVSATTILWGVMTGSYLGIPNLPAPLEALQVEWLGDRNNLINLCFFIGAVHLTIAHVWNAIETSPRTKILAELGWISILWAMFLLARKMVLNYAFPSFALYMLVAGIVAVVLFMATPKEIKTNWINHALLPLTVIGQFVDVLSYVRLFAVGYASVAILEAFNMMASNIGFSTLPKAAAAILVLVLANSLNMVLGALAVLIHGVRLNTLEFSTHKGIAWQGAPFEPFARKG